MTTLRVYQLIKLGMNIEYLTGVSSVSVMLTTSMVAFPLLTENQPPARFSVRRITEVLKSLLIQLDDLGLERSLAAAEPLRPILAEMQKYLDQAPAPDGVILQDHFAEALLAHVRAWLPTLKEETGAMNVAVANQ